MNKKVELARLAKQIQKCRKCRLWKTRTKAVPGDGPANAKIMLIGEAPGREEDKQGRPFVGFAGKKLNELLNKAGVDRKKCFITSPIKCRPPKNRKPKSDELKACMPYLKQQIEIIKPKLIVLLGEVAAKALVGKIQLKKIRSKKFLINHTIYFVTYHPAAARFPKIKAVMEKDFKKLKKLVSRF